MRDKRQNLDTDSLLGILQGPLPIRDTLETFGNSMTNPVLCDYLSEQMRKYGFTPSDVILKGNLSKSFMYQILNGTRIPNRNILLRIAFAVGLNLDETQRMLAIAQRGMLYPKIRRDAAIIFCLDKGCALEQANNLLEDIGEEALL